VSRRDAAPAGCALLGVLLIAGLNIAWVSLLIWAVYTLVAWLTSK
jgi:hypothetical protein